MFISCLYRYDCQKKNSFALLWAAKNGNESTARISIQYGANPDPKDDHSSTPLSYAASEGHEAIVSLLLNMDAVNPDSSTDNGWISLSKAASDGYEAIVKLLLILYACRDILMYT